jgi:DNA repair protein RadC
MYTYKTKQEVTQAAMMFIAENMKELPLINNPSLATEAMTLKIGGEKREHFAVMFLDTKHKLIEHEILFSGTIDGASVYPREVVRRALELNASAIIIGHNHPSGDCTPSKADETITMRISNACELLEIRMLDHLIVSKAGKFSFAENGLI